MSRELIESLCPWNWQQEKQMVVEKIETLEDLWGGSVGEKYKKPLKQTLFQG